MKEVYNKIEKYLAPQFKGKVLKRDDNISDPEFELYGTMGMLIGVVLRGDVVYYKLIKE